MEWADGTTFKLHLLVCVSVSRHLGGGQGMICGSWFSPSAEWILEIKLQPPGFAAIPTPLSNLAGPKELLFFFFLVSTSKVRRCFNGMVSLNDCSWGLSWLTTAYP